MGVRRTVTSGRCGGARVCVLLVVLSLLGGCRQKMFEQPRYEPYEPSAFFPDSMSARPVQEGTVARGFLWMDAAYYTGTNPYYSEEGELIIEEVEPGLGYAGTLVDAFPFEVTLEVLVRGRHQYDIYCSPCHGRTGYGAGMIVQRGLRPPPSFHTERLRNAPVGHFFNVITNGYGAMYSYAARIPPEDRWAVIAYIRALQLSQNATVADVPTDTLVALQREMQEMGGQP